MKVKKHSKLNISKIHRGIHGPCIRLGGQTFVFNIPKHVWVLNKCNTKEEDFDAYSSNSLRKYLNNFENNEKNKKFFTWNKSRNIKYNKQKGVK